MSAVEFEKPHRFQREYTSIFGGAAIAAGAATLLQIIAGWEIPWMSGLAFGGIVGLVLSLRDQEEGTWFLRLALALLGGISLGFLAQFSWLMGAFVGGVLLAFAVFATDKEPYDWRTYGVVGFTGLLTALGFYTADVLAAGYPAFIANSITCMTLAFFLSTGVGARRLSARPNPMADEYTDALQTMTPRDRDRLKMGRKTYEEIRARIASFPPEFASRAESAVDETFAALVKTLKRNSEMRTLPKRQTLFELEKKIAEYEKQLAHADDPQVKGAIMEVLDELIAQKRERNRLEAARVRVEARVEKCFTALDRLHISLIQSGSSDTHDGLRYTMDELEDLNDSLAAQELTLEELLHDTGPGADTEAVEVATVTGSEVEEPPPEDLKSSFVLDTGHVHANDEPMDELGAPGGVDGNVEMAEEHAERSR